MVPQTDRESFAVREFKLKRFPSGWHYHPEIELTWVVESSGRRWVGDHVNNYQAGDLVLIGPNVPHYWMNDETGRPDEMAHSIVIQFRRDCFGADFFSLVEMRGVDELLKRSMRGLQFDGAVRDRVAGRMSGLLGMVGLPRFVELVSILGELAKATDAKPLSSPGFTPRPDQGSVERVDKIYEYIARRSASDFNHAELAGLLGMSPSGLSHYFKRTVGTTLSSFVAEVRIGQACRHLILGDRPVSEIAFKAGFENLSSFNAWFRRLRGMSPRDFRQSHRRGS
nr:AraC family transcriptional regulator [Luteolibacter marinus]